MTYPYRYLFSSIMLVIFFLSFFGRCLASSNDIQPAQVCLNTDAKKISELQKHILSLLDNHRAKEALQEARTANEMAPKDEDIKALLIKAIVRVGNYEEAVKIFSELSPELHNAYDLVACIDAARLAIEGQNHIANGYVSQRQEDYLAGAVLFEEAAQLDSENLSLLKTLGWIYLDRIYQPKKAYPYLKKASELNPGDLDTKKMYAVACSETGHAKLAIALYSDVLSRDPNDLWMQTNLAKSIAQIGNYGEAHSIYNRILETDPENFSARLGIAELLAWQGEKKHAIQACKLLLTKAPESPAIHSLLGDLHRWDFELGIAKEEYESAISAQSNYYPAIFGLSEIEKLHNCQSSAKYYASRSSFDSRKQPSFSLRTPLSDKSYVALWLSQLQFKNNEAQTNYRIRQDKGIDFDYHHSRKNETHVGIFSYSSKGNDDHQYLILSARLSPTPKTDVYLHHANREPVVDNITTVTDGLSQDAYGLGLDIKIRNDISAQGMFNLAQYSDGNKRRNLKAQLSYRLPRGQEDFLRLSYESLSYDSERSTYWTPQLYQKICLLLETSYGLREGEVIALSSELPYILEKNKFAWGIKLKSTLKLSSKLKLGTTYSICRIPPNKASSWSGEGFEIELHGLF